MIGYVLFAIVWTLMGMVTSVLVIKCYNEYITTDGRKTTYREAFEMAVFLLIITVFVWPIVLAPAIQMLGEQRANENTNEDKHTNDSAR